MSRIFSTSKPLPVGKIVQPADINVKYITDDEGNDHPPQPFYVIRESNRAEYLAQYADDKYRVNLRYACQNPAQYFYEIHMD